jgi:hypothetical protein
LTTTGLSVARPHTHQRDQLQEVTSIFHHLGARAFRSIHPLDRRQRAVRDAVIVIPAAIVEQIAKFTGGLPASPSAAFAS